MTKFTQRRFNKLYDENISKKEYDQILNEIDEEFNRVVRLLGYTSVYDYHNGNLEIENDEGYFDPSEYKNKIYITSDSDIFDPPFNNSEIGSAFIPTRWLWTNNEEIRKEYDHKVEQYKQKIDNEKETRKQKRLARKAYLAEMRLKIGTKLTPEELMCIKFK